MQSATVDSIDAIRACKTFRKRAIYLLHLYVDAIYVWILLATDKVPKNSGGRIDLVLDKKKKN